MRCPPMSAQLGASFPAPSPEAEDPAHPQWWHGHASSQRLACDAVTAILDCRHPPGGLAGPPWASVRQRLVDLVERASSIEPQAPAMRWVHINDRQPAEDGRYLIVYRNLRGERLWREASLIYGRWFCAGDGFDPLTVECWCRVELPGS